MAPLDTAGLDHERIWLEPRTPDDLYGHEGRTWCQDKVWPAEWDDAEPTEYVRADLYDALSRELAEARAASDAAAYDLVAGWHERQAKLFREMADDEPRTAEAARKRATEAAIHHAASAAALRNRAITERRARTVLSREKEAGA